MRFYLTTKHIKLLQSMHVSWQNAEAGAPAIDPKRPYGNSDVARDVLEILGNKPDEEGDYVDSLRQAAMRLHADTKTALQIVLVMGAFAPGEYVKTDRYDDRSWRRS